MDKTVDYGEMIDAYLQTKIIDPTIVFNNTGLGECQLQNHLVSWQETDSGIEINIDGHEINLWDKSTLNTVWGSGVDDVNFANYINQVQLFAEDSILTFVFTNWPCNGLGCGVNYQLIYDLKSKRESYFGRFRTGIECHLYHFNEDQKPDYLSKTFNGRNIIGVDTTLFVMYSQTKEGNFTIFSNDQQKVFSFSYAYTEFHSDLDNEYFEESWIERINKKPK